MSSSEDFPAPEGPMMATREPGWKLPETCLRMTFDPETLKIIFVKKGWLKIH